MYKKLFRGLAVLSFIFLCSNFAFAKSVEDEVKELKARIAELEERLAKEETKPSSIELSNMTIEDFDKHLDSHLLHKIEGYQLLGGLRMGLGATFIVQGTDNANGDDLSGKGEDVTDSSYSIDVEFEKEFESYGKAYLHLETGDGTGVEDELKLFSNVNRDADDSDNSISLTEIWYENYFERFPASLMVGKIDGTILVDANNYANDEVTQFLGRIFRNSPVIEFPDNSAGFCLNVEPQDFMDIQVLLMDADSDWEDIVDDIFFATQLNLKPDLFERNGNYRILGWLNDREHTKWNDPASTKEKSYGFGISFDQELTDSLGAFLRYGWQDPDIYLNGESFSLEHAWSAGVQIAGTSWNREGDIIGLAVGQAMPSSDYKNAGTNLNAKDEGHFEAYYNYKVNDHLTLTPDLQIIWNPYGKDATNGSDTIVVGGVKGQVDF